MANVGPVASLKFGGVTWGPNYTFAVTTKFVPSKALSNADAGQSTPTVGTQLKATTSWSYLGLLGLLKVVWVLTQGYWHSSLSNPWAGQTVNKGSGANQSQSGQVL